MNVEQEQTVIVNITINFFNFLLQILKILKRLLSLVVSFKNLSLKTLAWVCKKLDKQEQHYPWLLDLLPS